jgi:hypothetical protein
MARRIVTRFPRAQLPVMTGGHLARCCANPLKTGGFGAKEYSQVP